MRAYYCPTCGRFLCAIDASAPVKVRLPSCRTCKTRTLVTAAPPRLDKPPPPR